MKIAMVGPSYPFKGGISEHTTLLYRRLATEHQVLFISFKRQYPDWLYPGESDQDPTYTELQEDAAHQIIDSLNPLSWQKAVSEICQFKPDLVIFPWWVMYWAPTYIYIIRSIKLRRKTARIMFLCHNVISHESGVISRFLTRQTLMLGDGFTVHSAQDGRELENIRKHGKIIAVELPSHPVAESERGGRDKARKKLGLSGDVVLFFGFIRPYKGLEVLLKAMAAVLESHKCTLVIAGEIWGDSTELVTQIEQLDIGDEVRLLGEYIPQQHVADYFMASDLVVLPYLSATGSAIAKLAYSYHRPVVVSDVGSLPDSVLPGETGYIVPAGDSSALAASILTYFTEADRASMEKAIARHALQFGWDQLVEAVESLGTA